MLCFEYLNNFLELVIQANKEFQLSLIAASAIEIDEWTVVQHLHHIEHAHHTAHAH
jgi:hypothetical protein